MEAAAALIRKDGVPSLRIEEIAERAGLSVGTFYLYFDGKADLFVNLVVDYTERLQERLRAAYESEGNAIERLQRALDAYLDFVSDHESGFLYFRNAGTVDTTVGSISSWAFSVHAEDLKPVLREAMESGQIRDVDPELAAQTILGLHQHVAGYWLENKDRVSREEVREFLASFVAVGLAPR